MTNEEIIKILYQEIHDTKVEGKKYAFLKNSCDKKCKALNVAIKALEFKNDILSLWDNYNKPEPYYPEYLEEDFTNVMRKWEEKE